MKLIPIHPLADILPMMGEEEYAVLRADIARNGHKIPIVLHEHKVLDGRARYRACLEMGLTPLVTEWNGKGSPLEFVVGQNLIRRRLPPSHRAMIAARQVADHGHRSLEFTMERLAKLFGVSVSAVRVSRIVLTNGAPEEIALVESGAISPAVLSKQIRNGIPFEDRQKSGYLGRSARKDTMTKMGQVAYEMLAAKEIKSLRRRAVTPKPEAPVLATDEADEADTLLVHVSALLKATGMSPRDAAAILAKDITPYVLDALFDWLIETQNEIHILTRSQRNEAAA